jgi:hypothetical protein
LESVKDKRSIDQMTARLYVLFEKSPRGKELRDKGMYGDNGVKYWHEASAFKERKLREWLYFDKNPFEGSEKKTSFFVKIIKR